MNNEKQNQFYTSISKYYSEIFPYNPMQINFVKSGVGDLNGKHILDIGCATGELAFQLVKDGANVTGIDLNADLLQQAIGSSGFQSADFKKRQSDFVLPNPKFQIGNMLDLKNDFQAGQFDAVLCFGNTLVHLQTIDLISEMLKGVFTVLKPEGKFLMQILNYDYILDEPVAELPLIETENIRFVRKYKSENNPNLLQFQTDLELKKENRIVSNSTSLYALRSKELRKLLEDAGFLNIQFFSNFKQDVFGGKHLPLVVRCSK